jgi:hypothetical protein
LRLLFIEKLTELFGERGPENTWNDVVDLAVYEDNGLRMVGCRKMGICKGCKNKKEFRDTCVTCSGAGKIDEGRVYSPKMVFPENDDYLKTLKQDLYVQLLETSIYNYSDFDVTECIKKLEIRDVEKKKKSVAEKQDSLNSKVENFIRRNFKETHSKIKIQKITKDQNDQKYFIEPDENFCINVNRNHTSSGIYFQVTPAGICQRCYCKKDTLEGRSQGSCKLFSSPLINLTKTIQTLLFGNVSSKRGKKISTFNLSRNSSTSTLDLGLGVVPKKMFTNKEICLENCKSILLQLEKELMI